MISRLHDNSTITAIASLFRLPKPCPGVFGITESAATPTQARNEASAHLHAKLKYFATLDEDRAWLLRRVETIQLVDRNRFERRVTLDIDMPKVVAIARESGLIVDTYVELPLALEAKGLHIELDLRAGDGTVLHLLPSSEDAIASLALVHDWLNRSNHACDPRRRALEQHLLKIAAMHFDTGKDVQLTQFLYGELDCLPAWKSEDPSTARIFDELMQEDEFAAHVVDLSTHCRPVVRLPTSDSTTVLKVRKVELGRRPEVGPAARFRLSPAILTIEDSTLGRGASTHLRIVAPEGTQFEGVQVTSYDTIKRYRRRVTPERTMIHAGRDFGIDERVVHVPLRPSSRGFLSLGLATCALGALAAFTVLFLEFVERKYVTEFAHENADVVFAALLALPSVFVLFLARSNEHDLRSYLMSGLRGCLYVVGASQTLAAIALMVHGRYPDLLLPSWLAAFGVSSAAALVLTASESSARRSAPKPSPSPFPDTSLTIPFHGRPMNSEA